MVRTLLTEEKPCQVFELICFICEDSLDQFLDCHDNEDDVPQARVILLGGWIKWTQQFVVLKHYGLEHQMGHHFHHVFEETLWVLSDVLLQSVFEQIAFGVILERRIILLIYDELGTEVDIGGQHHRITTLIQFKSKRKIWLP